MPRSHPDTLRVLITYNRVILEWVGGQQEIEGNNTADLPAEKGAKESLVRKGISTLLDELNRTTTIIGSYRAAAIKQASYKNSNWTFLYWCFR